MMPLQKPGKSRQDYGTPPDLLMAVQNRLGQPFGFDVACTSTNSVAARGFYFDRGENALAGEISWARHARGKWAWLNSPYDRLDLWTERASWEAALGLSLAMLVPASVGSLWWKQYVEPFAYALHLCPRVTFVGETTPYPKDTSILIYTPLRLRGAETWVWK